MLYPGRSPSKRTFLADRRDQMPLAHSIHLRFQIFLDPLQCNVTCFHARKNIWIQTLCREPGCRFCARLRSRALRSGGSWSLLGRRASLLLGCMLQYDVYAVCDGGVMRYNTAGARATSRWAEAEASLSSAVKHSACERKTLEGRNTAECHVRHLSPPWRRAQCLHTPLASHPSLT